MVQKIKKGQWTSKEVTFLRKHYRSYSTSWIARELGRTEYAVRYKASDLNIRKGPRGQSSIVPVGNRPKTPALDKARKILGKQKPFIGVKNLTQGLLIKDRLGRKVSSPSHLVLRVPSGSTTTAHAYIEKACSDSTSAEDAVNAILEKEGEGVLSELLVVAVLETAFIRKVQVEA